MARISGGDKIGPSLRARVEQLTRASGVEVGFAEGATYTDGTSVPLVAAVNEFGRPDKGQPPRPFMRNTIAKHGGEWASALPAVLRGVGFDAHKALEQIGQGIQAHLTNEIATLTSPALAPSTVKAKGFEKPLVDTGFMLQHVSVNVED